jgi:hypothetical protein
MIVVVLASFLLPFLADGSAWVFAAPAVDVVAIAALLMISRRKTEGEWRWRWGSD